MRSLLILFCVGLVFAGEDMFDDEKSAKKWAKFKAMESCFGDDMMKTSLLKMKKAAVKCTGMDMPEMELPMFKSPHRVVHALLESAEDHEQMKLLAGLSKMKQSTTNSNQPLQIVLGQQTQQPQDDFFKKMVMKMMMKKMFKGDSPFGNMERGMDMDDNKYDLLKMLTNSRNKRATDDVFELGDKLAEKLEMETEKIQKQLNNASCILEELNIIDDNQDLDVNGMVQAAENDEWGEWPDEWLKEHHIKNCRNCVSFAESIPRMVLEECPYGEKWGKIKMFMHCEKMHKWKMCMNHDMMKKLEKHFGKLKDLEKATGLQEHQLLPLVQKLLHEQMDGMMDM